jgi:sugar O-acyltransferase (sialic acid O-acetyltransferase NeuD family)
MLRVYVLINHGLGIAMVRLQSGESVVIVGVESDFAPDVMDSIGRLGAQIVATVLLGPNAWDLMGVSPYQPNEIPKELLTGKFFVTRNNPGLRKVKTIKARELGFSMIATIVDPTAVISPSARLGVGVYVNAGAVIAGQASLGDGVFVNRLAGVGHHSVLDDYVSVGPGVSIASKVKIGTGTMVGAGASIAPSVTIGSNSVIAAGTAVHKDVPSNVVVMGNPFRIAKTGIVGHGGYGV